MGKKTKMIESWLYSAGEEALNAADLLLFEEMCEEEEDEEKQKKKPN